MEKAILFLTTCAIRSNIVVIKLAALEMTVMMVAKRASALEIARVMVSVGSDGLSGDYDADDLDDLGGGVSVLMLFK